MNGFRNLSPASAGRGVLAGLAVLMLATGCARPAPNPASPFPPTTESASSWADSSSSGPAGLPADWSTQAIAAAASVLRTCVHSTSLQPSGCPQRFQKPWTVGEVLSAHWTLLDTPFQDAVATPPAIQSGATATQVTVYGHYEMSVSYTARGQSIRPYLGYTGGIAEATMNWDGHSFQDVILSSSDSALPNGTSLRPFSRPASVTDDSVVQATKSGFDDCVTIKVTAATSTPPNCPNGESLDPYFTNLLWTLDGDPMQGALVTFDTDHGDFTVTGSLAMTLRAVRQVPGQAAEPRTFKINGNYTATLSWDGHRLALLTITDQ